MSANNWSACPKCKAKRHADIAKRRSKAEQQYGKISSTDYLKLIDSINADAVELPEQTLREDYRICVDANCNPYVSYLCHCDKCGFELTFEYEHGKGVTIKRHGMPEHKGNE